MKTNRLMEFVGICAVTAELAAFPCLADVVLPDTAWRDGGIVFDDVDAGMSYRMVEARTAKGVDFCAAVSLSGETLMLDAPALVRGSGELLTPLDGSAGVTFCPAARSGVAPAADVFLQSASALLWSNALLASTMRITGDICGGVVQNGQVYVPAEMFHFVRNGTTATAQFHCLDDFSMPDGSAKFVKAIKVQFDQVGKDIHAKILWAKYAEAAKYGLDFDTVAANGVYETYATARNSAHAIGITHLALHGDLVVDGHFPAGDVAVEADTLTIFPQAPVTITNTISGRADQVVFRGSGTAPVAWTHPDFIPADYEGIFASNTSIHSLKFVSAQMSGGYVNNRNSVDASLYGSYAKFTGDELVLQVQYFDRNGNDSSGITKMIFLHFAQRGRDVYLVRASAHFVDGAFLNVDNSAGPGNSSVATGDDGDGYGIHNVVLSYVPGVWPITLSGDCRNALPDGTRFVVDGTDLAVKGKYMLSRAYDLIVTNRANVTFSLPDGNFVGHADEQTNAITVCRDCTFTVERDWNVNSCTTIDVDAGLLNLPVRIGPEGDCLVYLQRLTLRNGARVTGKPFRAGYYRSVTHYVHSRGEGENVIENGVMGAYDHVNRPYLDYYLFRTDADLLVKGPLIDAVEWKGLNWTKTGAAALTLSGKSTTEGWFRVDEGTLRLGTDGALARTNAVTLAGGSLDGAAFTNRLGSLTLTANSSIVVGEGVLEFSDSSAMAWAPGVQLSLTGDVRKLERGHVRFRRDESPSPSPGLSEDQLAALRYNGDQRVQIDDDGWLRSAPSGTLLLFR